MIMLSYMMRAVSSVQYYLHGCYNEWDCCGGANQAQGRQAGAARGWFNIKMLSYQYMDFHYNWSRALLLLYHSPHMLRHDRHHDMETLYTFIKLEILSFCWKFIRWLHRKLSWHLPVKPMKKKIKITILFQFYWPYVKRIHLVTNGFPSQRASMVLKPWLFVQQCGQAHNKANSSALPAFRVIHWYLVDLFKKRSINVQFFSCHGIIMLSHVLL